MILLNISRYIVTLKNAATFQKSYSETKLSGLSIPTSTKSVIHPNLPIISSAGGIQGQTRIIRTVAPDGKEVVRSILPKIDNGIGNHFMSAATSSAGSSSIVTSTPVQPQKPITIMARDPKTGLLRPVTLLPKQAANKAPMAIRLAPPIGQVSHQCHVDYFCSVKSPKY